MQQDLIRFLQAQPSVRTQTYQESRSLNPKRKNEAYGALANQQQLSSSHLPKYQASFKIAVVHLEE